MGHVLMENRNGLAVESEVTHATGTSERIAALNMVKRRARKGRRITLGGDKGYDVNEFIEDLRAIKVTPHISQRADGRDTVLDGRTTRHPGYGISISKRKLIEQIFGWLKSAGLLRQVRIRGVARIGALWDLALSMYNILRIRNLAAA